MIHCPTCGRQFTSGKAIGGHRSACGKRRYVKHTTPEQKRLARAVTQARYATFAAIEQGKSETTIRRRRLALLRATWAAWQGRVPA